MECYLIGWMFLLECPRGPVWVHGYFWEGFHMWKFADDTTVSEVVPASKHSSLQQAADHIHDWSQQNHLQLNPTKCKEIRTYFKRTPPLLLSGVNRRGRVRKGIFNKIAAIYSQHVASRCITLDLVAPVPRPCARLTDLETVLLLATVYNYIYIYISSRLTRQELLLVTYSGK